MSDPLPSVQIIQEELDETALGHAGLGPKDEQIISGGDPSHPTWDEYIASHAESFRPRIEAIRAAIEREGLVGTCADEFCNDHHFRFDDGLVVSFTWRAWGDLMQAIVGKKEGYMAYYMRRLRDEEERNDRV